MDIAELIETIANSVRKLHDRVDAAEMAANEQTRIAAELRMQLDDARAEIGRLRVYDTHNTRDRSQAIRAKQIADKQRDEAQAESRASAEKLESILNEIEALRSEVDCRIGHGAESGGHLEFVRAKLDGMMGDRDPSLLSYSAKALAEECDREITDAQIDERIARVVDKLAGAMVAAVAVRCSSCGGMLYTDGLCSDCREEGAWDDQA